MPKVDIDSLSDEELDAYLARVSSSQGCAPSDHQRAGGAPLELSIVMLVSGIAGMFASLELILAEKNLLLHPNAQLICDINPVIGCGTFLQSAANTLFFGVSNAVFGLAFFAGITALGLVAISGGRLGTWLWQLLDIAMLGAFLWLLWFWHTAFFVEKGLCPYCMVVWAVTIPLIFIVIGRSAEAGYFPAPQPLRRILFTGRWYATVGCYLALILFAVVWFWDKWMMIF